ncbi:MAG: hypothetical protein KAH38_00625, partial [Candidatus Hydrogenedentes bacterium]|nr:hypothetical protein [Candidatus Hydrogenedentota bacterium]
MYCSNLSVSERSCHLLLIVFLVWTALVTTVIAEDAATSTLPEAALAALKSAPPLPEKVKSFDDLVMEVALGNLTIFDLES